MADTTERVSALLHEAAETHHRVYRITDGADDDWATWYSDWLVERSELPTLLARKPVRSELTQQLVTLDQDFTEAVTDLPWEQYYAERLVTHFG